MNLRQFFSGIASAIRNSDPITWTIVATWVLFYFGNISGTRYTGWDTHELGFENFLYFSDALRSLSLPLWNPLIQGGTFYPTLFNGGSYSPFQWIFILLSYVVNPVYAYELMAQVAILIGAAGFYFLLRSEGNNKYVSLFGANAFFLSALMPITGQIGFVFSLGSLPWLLLFCREILLGDRQISWLGLIFWASLTASFMSLGYPWLNAIDPAIAFLYACNLIWINRTSLTATQMSSMTSRMGRLMGFLAGVAILLFCYYLPGYLAMKFNYQNLVGDYVTPDIALRGLGPIAHHSYDGIKEALVSAVNPEIIRHNAGWSLGAGLVVWIALFYRKLEKGFASRNFFWIGMAIFWIAYSAGELGFIEKVPLLNANRWWFIGQFYVLVCLILLAAANLQHGFARIQAHSFSRLRLAIVSVGVMALLLYFSAPILVLVFALCTITLFYYLARSASIKEWQQAIVLLICLNTTIFLWPHVLDKPVQTRLSISRQDPDNYISRVEHRVKSVNVTDNLRHIDKSSKYSGNDESWLLDKIPFSHGYNPLGNPLYWYLKNDDFVGHLVSMAYRVRQERPLQRGDFVSDNSYVDALIEDVRSNETVPTVDRIYPNLESEAVDFQWSLKELKQEPNVATIKVQANNAGYLLFSNTYFPGWEVFVNGRKAALIKVNRVFMGVYLEKPGEHEIVFRFSSLSTVTLLLFPSIVLLVSLMFLLSDKHVSLKKALFFFVSRPVRNSSETV